MSKLKYAMIIQWSEEDDCFLVGFPDFPGQHWRTHGDTYESAVTSGIEALESLILAYEITGDSLPEPTLRTIKIITKRVPKLKPEELSSNMGQG